MLQRAISSEFAKVRTWSGSKVPGRSILINVGSTISRIRAEESHKFLGIEPQRIVACYPLLNDSLSRSRFFAAGGALLILLRNRTPQKRDQSDHCQQQAPLSIMIWVIEWLLIDPTEQTVGHSVLLALRRCNRCFSPQILYRIFDSLVILAESSIIPDSYKLSLCSDVSLLWIRLLSSWSRAFLAWSEVDVGRSATTKFRKTGVRYPIIDAL
jgi:hypothetical protein